MAACSMYSQRRGGYVRGVRRSLMSAQAVAASAANNCTMASHQRCQIVRRSGMRTIGVAQAGFAGRRNPEKGLRTSSDIISPLVLFDGISATPRMSKR